jgi:hypothetical protein
VTDGRFRRDTRGEEISSSPVLGQGASDLGGDTQIATGGSDARSAFELVNAHETDRLLATGLVAATFDRQSGLIISGSFDTTVRVWKLNANEPSGGTTAGAAGPSRVR